MKVLVVYHSLHGHVFQLAKAITEGVESVNGVEAVLRRVQEFEVVHKQVEKERDEVALRMLEEQKHIPICTLDELRSADGLIIGSSGRYGNMSAQMKFFIDSTASIWVNGDLEGKPAGVFAASGTTHGGQEAALLTMMIPLLQLGMIIVGIPFSTPGMLHSEARGGTPYGASTIAGLRNELQPPREDLDIARALGRRVAGIAAKLRSE
jgi:NAD(P)H dehydrogenase (quinone)